ncbi:Hypothetical predicted protein [Mytilus galloprovincialis]|uniref:Fibrinogen C-terminal domain-containing protein n=1 Tax=Mytilus galloprovincialis TaxID=29158 RepID=A0A8B6DRT4_MYTGA|nr:Hypothetical predicted protein [Mytilus galloprovincialis]
MKFSTYDRDSDEWPTVNCAATRKGGWWYNNCYMSNLNGKYLRGKYDAIQLNYKGNTWGSWLGNNYALKTSVMMIRTY